MPVPNAARLRELDYFLVSDIDNTLTGDSAACRELRDLLRFSHHRIGFGVATGRGVSSAVEVLSDLGFDHPDIIVTAVGSEIYYGRQLAPDLDYAASIGSGWRPRRLRSLMGSLPGVSLQPAASQRPYKLSYRLAGSSAEHEVRQALRQSSLECTAVFSHRSDLDLLPVRASKGYAVQYLAERWGLLLANIVVAGDSGNDTAMLTCGANAVVVHNHYPEVDHLRGAPGVYFSSEAHARGVLDGCAHFRLFDRALLAHPRTPNDEPSGIGLGPI